jgi:general stress protein 26
LNRVEGLEESFRVAKVVWITTFGEGSEERSRKMTNLNNDPYRVMWFPTELGSRKVEDIKRNPRALITFPAAGPGEYYEIEGRAELEDPEMVEEKWLWWYLYWHPSQRSRFWFPRGMSHSRKAIVNIHPISARLVKRREK